MDFKENLIILRKQAGLSQEDLGNKIDVSRQTISKWELGTTSPELNKIIALSELFNVSIDKLIKGTEMVESSYEVRDLNFEFKSNAMINGVPIVHVNIGKGLKKAYGIIAVGNFATGIISFGGIATGVISFGGISLGVISCAGIAAGVIAVGGISAGVLAVGGLAIGYEAFGAITYILKNIL
jgi:transcriptional regulator with XRE-family HTH domain